MDTRLNCCVAFAAGILLCDNAVPIPSTGEGTPLRGNHSGPNATEER